MVHGMTYGERGAVWRIMAHSSSARNVNSVRQDCGGVTVCDAVPGVANSVAKAKKA